MKISVVTPSFNQGAYIEDTIKSVINQGVDGLEYIIIDGGSTDNTVEILKKYDEYIHYWHSQPDDGQVDAIQKGFDKASGDIICWINSDDYYLPGVLNKIVDFFSKNREAKLVYGDYIVLRKDGQLEAKPKVSFDFDICLNSYLMIPQPSSFWLRSVYDEVGGLDSSLNYAFDYDFFLRIGYKYRHDAKSIIHQKDLFSVFRLHDESKSVSEMSEFKKEHKKIKGRFEMPSSRIHKKAKKYYYFLLLLVKYYSERGIIPLKKDDQKA